MLRENISCLRFLPNRNVFYDISLSHKQKHEFVLVSMGRKVPKARSVRGSILAVIRLRSINSSRVFDKGKFEKMGFW